MRCVKALFASSGHHRTSTLSQQDRESSPDLPVLKMFADSPIFPPEALLVRYLSEVVVNDRERGVLYIHYM